MNQGVEMLKNKKQFYITELHFGDDGLESYLDYSGPFTLIKARKVMERMLKFPDPWINPYSFAIRGPYRTEGGQFYGTREDR
jgi:hypothetical protein